jgi:hypothetical protein
MVVDFGGKWVRSEEEEDGWKAEMVMVIISTSKYLDK